MAKLHHTNATFLRLRGIAVGKHADGFTTINTNPTFTGTGKAICAAIKAHEAETGKKLRGMGSAEKSGVMLKVYHDEYTANGGGNGDLLDQTMRDVFMTAGTEAEPALDVAKLAKFAKQHDVWNAKYEGMNPGMVRMNVANRLRALCRKGEVNVAGVVIGPQDVKPARKAA